MLEKIIKSSLILSDFNLDLKIIFYLHFVKIDFVISCPIYGVLPFCWLFSFTLDFSATSLNKL